MRKFIVLFAVVIGMMIAVSCSSCTNDGSNFGIEYTLQSEGKTDGSFDLQVAVATFNVNGDAIYTFDLSSKTVDKLFTTKDVKSLESAINSNDAKLAETAQKVNNWLDNSVKITAFTGHYDIWVRGYVMETFTGLKFEIDRHFTNYPPAEEK